MPRKNRIHYRSAFHHVMLRGNNRKNIFYKREDYQIFLDTIRAAADAYNFKTHLYCLMTNHIHLVVEVGDIPISRIMQSVSSRYAKLHNKKYNKIGQLFQGRFKSKLISDDYYLMELCYYIHMNPIRAKICRSLDEYQWSSHHGYKSSEVTNWFATDYIRKIILDHFGRAAKYEEFIANYKKENFNPLFCKFNERGDLDIIHAKYTFDDIAAVVCRQPNSISKTLRRYLKLANTDSEVRHVLSSIEKELSISDVDRWVG